MYRPINKPPAPVPRRWLTRSQLIIKSQTEDGAAKKLPSSNTKKANGSTATSSAGASPKPGPKLKEAKDIYPTPPPLPGSGLMQLGGIGGGPNDGMY